MSAGQKGSGVPLTPPFSIVAVRPLRACGADLVDECAVRFEFQDLRIVPEIRRPRILAMEIAGLAIAGDVDEVVLIDVDAMLARRPDATVLLAALRLQEARITRTAPGLQQFACFVEHEHRRRGHTAAVRAAHTGRGNPSALIGLPFASLPAAPCIPLSVVLTERGRW